MSFNKRWLQNECTQQGRHQYIWSSQLLCISQCDMLQREKLFVLMSHTLTIQVLANSPLQHLTTETKDVGTLYDYFTSLFTAQRGWWEKYWECKRMFCVVCHSEAKTKLHRKWGMLFVVITHSYAICNRKCVLLICLVIFLLQVRYCNSE